MGVKEMFAINEFKKKIFLKQMEIASSTCTKFNKVKPTSPRLLPQN